MKRDRQAVMSFNAFVRRGLYDLPIKEPRVFDITDSEQTSMILEEDQTAFRPGLRPRSVLSSRFARFFADTSFSRP